jgi:steroid delta-isomerase-like uncharacterized protein
MTTTTTDIGRSFFEAQDRLRGGPAAELCAPGYVASIAGFPTFDLAGHQQFASAFYAAFPDLDHTIDDVVVEDGKVAVRFTLTGTHRAAFDGIPATGRPIRVAASAVLHVAGGRVTRLDALFDQLGLLRQLGALPAPGARSERAGSAQ